MLSRPVEYYRDRAKEMFLSGYNCSQAVVMAFIDELDVDKNAALLMASPFGGGLGRLREVCGTVSGMCMAAGLMLGYSDPKAYSEKAALYAHIQNMAAAFKEKNGSYICRELLKGVVHTDGGAPEKRTEEYYKKRPCPQLCADAAEILARYVKDLQEEEK